MSLRDFVEEIRTVQYDIVDVEDRIGRLRSEREGLSRRLAELRAEARTSVGATPHKMSREQARLHVEALYGDIVDEIAAELR